MLDRWFESEQLKATLATDAIIGAYAAPSMPGTAYVLFHHVMGETNGKRGVWAYVKGGMGGLTQALAKAAKDLGVEIRCDAEVAKILVKDGAVTGVALANGNEFHAGKVASNLDCRLTFTKSARSQDPAARLHRGDSAGSITTAPRSRSTWPCRNCPTSPPVPAAKPVRSITAPSTSAPIRITSNAASTTAKYGRPSRDPILECTMPSAVDPSVAPPGKHLMSMFIQYAPYKLKEGTWDDARKNQFADRCFDLLNDYAPNFKKSVIDRQILTPVDLERCST